MSKKEDFNVGDYVKTYSGKGEITALGRSRAMVLLDHTGPDSEREGSYPYNQITKTENAYYKDIAGANGWNIKIPVIRENGQEKLDKNSVTIETLNKLLSETPEIGSETRSAINRIVAFLAMGISI